MNDVFNHLTKKKEEPKSLIRTERIKTDKENNPLAKNQTQPLKGIGSLAISVTKGLGDKRGKVSPRGSPRMSARGSE